VSLPLNEEHILLVKAWKKFGEEAQLQVLEEECAELIQAISKLRRGKIRFGKVIEEVVDVDLCIAQFRLFNKGILWNQYHDAKVKRLKELIGDFKL